jgi:class 3 adenylate cyclase
VIADYQRCCTEVIGGFGGVVATALFRLPGAHEYDVERAVRAGLALIGSVGSLNIPLAPALHVRVGIASGLVVAGSAALDKSDGHEPVAIAEVPHFAALAQPDAVVIAVSTRQGARSPALSLTLGGLPLGAGARG